jgi:hypothetical protein
MRSFVEGRFSLCLVLVSLVIFPGAKGCPPDPAEEDAEEAAVAEEVVIEVVPDSVAPLDPQVVSPPTSIVGTWASATCGERSYARELVFVEGGSYVRLDLVSPCPPDSLCVWSGIVHFTGGWRLEEDRVRLIEEVMVGSGGPAGFVSRPEALAVAGETLVAHVAGEDCVYTRTEAREVSGILNAK